jgi:hypothetical protein
MTESGRNVVTGTINSGATNIVADVTTLGAAVAVVLSTNYAALHWGPSRPSMTGTDSGDLDFPRTILSGTTITVLNCEAVALIAAAAAVPA